MRKKAPEEPLSVYDESELPTQKAKDIRSSPIDFEDYRPSPYKYKFKDEDINKDLYDKLKEELKDPSALKRELKSEDELEAELREDEWFFRDEWDFFTEDFNGLMEERNHDGGWETPCNESKTEHCTVVNKKTGEGSRVLSGKTGKEIIEEVINFEAFRYGTGPIRIYDYKKVGFRIGASSQDDVFLLPACKYGFIRDWEHDGVCVEIVEED